MEEKKHVWMGIERSKTVFIHSQLDFIIESPKEATKKKSTELITQFRMNARNKVNMKNQFHSYIFAIEIEIKNSIYNSLNIEIISMFCH